jgi:hypothetical protein
VEKRLMKESEYDYEHEAVALDTFTQAIRDAFRRDRVSGDYDWQEDSLTLLVWRLAGAQRALADAIARVGNPDPTPPDSWDVTALGERAAEVGAVCMMLHDYMEIVA